MGKSAIENGDIETGFNYYGEAAKLGHGEAAYILAIPCLLNKNVSVGIGWLNESANSGFVEAMKMLGDIYYEGKLVKSDSRKAAEWYEKVMQFGDENIKNEVQERLSELKNFLSTIGKFAEMIERSAKKSPQRDEYAIDDMEKIAA